MATNNSLNQQNHFIVESLQMLNPFTNLKSIENRLNCCWREYFWCRGKAYFKGLCCFYYYLNMLYFWWLLSILACCSSPLGHWIQLSFLDQIRLVPDVCLAESLPCPYVTLIFFLLYSMSLYDNAYIFMQLFSWGLSNFSHESCEIST